MDFAEGYEEGLNALLNRKINLSDLSENANWISWEKVKSYAKKVLYYLPGVGLGTHVVREYKTRKDKRPWYNLREAKDIKALAMYPVEIGYLALAISWKVWLGNGIATKEWNPIEQIKNYSEKSTERKEGRLENKNTLEKTINYKDLLK